MKNGSNTKGWIKRLTGSLLLVLVGGSLWAQQSSNTVVIVKSSNNAYFNQTIKTLGKHADPEIHFESVLAGAKLPTAKPRLYIALGQSAVDSLATIAGDVPVINAYLTLEQFHRLPQKRSHTVLLDQPLIRYLAFSKFVLRADSIGIMNETPILLNQQETNLLKTLDLSLNQYQLGPDNKLLPTLRKLLITNDALLMLPRQSIYNRDSLKGVLLTSYRGRKPVISYSPAHVKSGALASIYSSPTDIGRHVSLLMNEMLQYRQLAGPKFHFARFYSVSLNSRVAHALDLKLPGESKLREHLDGLAP